MIGVNVLKKDFPKILIVSHNTFSTTFNNGKTLTSIFSGWPKSKISQLFFQNEYPDFNVCDNFFCITDENILFEKKKNVGRNITSFHKESVIKSKSPIHSYARKKPLPIFNFFRNILWKSNKWNNENLYKWIEDFSPDIIFFVGGGSSFAYSIVNNISEKYKIPVSLYYTDDYITPVPTVSLFWWLNWIWLRIVLKKTLKSVKYIFVIGKDMAEEYSSKLQKTCIPIMNSVDTSKFTSDLSIRSGVEENNSLKIGYFGGMHLNRWKSLSVIGSVLKEISLEKNKKLNLSIYSNQIPEKGILEAITDPPFIEYCGSLNGEELIIEMNKYDILIHVESFDFDMRYKTRLSISTKIPEYLASGKPILAVGPKEISSMKYLEETGIAYTINTLDKTEIKNIINNILNESDSHEEIGLKGIKIAEEKHSIDKNRKLIFDVLLDH